jgi:hypothetical protein
MAEHLIFEERKIPGCVTLAEATLEGMRAAALQSAHLAVYGEFARLPLPLFVFDHAEETLTAVTRLIGPSISAHALETVRSLATPGLAAYVYYYPTAPVRARDVDVLLGGITFSRRSLALLTQIGDPDEIVRRWVRTFVRMLYLGYVPSSLSSLRTGSCCGPQNACIDGGFVDLGSVTPIADMCNDTALFAALQLSADALFETVRALLLGSTDPSRDERVGVRADLHYLRQYLSATIAAAIGEEERPGVALDSRIVRYFTPARDFEGLVERLGTYYAPEGAFAEAARTYRAFGMQLIRAARDV